jgi:hypothetical protein
LKLPYRDLVNDVSLAKVTYGFDYETNQTVFHLICSMTLTEYRRHRAAQISQSGQFPAGSNGRFPREQFKADR